MEIKVYQMLTGVPDYRGTIDLDCATFGESEAEQCWHLCNWSCWCKEKPENMHADIEVCGHGLALQAPTETWLSLSVGWMHGTSTEIAGYAMKHKNTIWWDTEDEKNE